MIIGDLNDAPRDLLGNYGGKSGFKYGITIDGERWMVKFPENTKGFAGLNKKNNHIPAYTTSPVSEYIGSQIYGSLGIPVHETMLGYRQGKIVVACKDFDLDHEFIDFDKIKNGLAEFEDNFIGSSGSSSVFRGEFLEDVLTVIEHSELMKNTKGIKEHFWDMFVVDGFIRNNDRNNGNWGIIARRNGGEILIAPVFDNGNSFFNKRNPSASEWRMLEPANIEGDAIGTNVSFFLTQDERHIQTFKFIESLSNPDCTAALLRFASRIDMEKVRGIINEIPEEAYGIPVLTSSQKSHYIAMLEIIVEKSLNPTLERLGQRGIDLHPKHSSLSNGLSSEIIDVKNNRRTENVAAGGFRGKR